MKVIKYVKLKDVMETLNKLIDRYEELRLLIADQVRDNQINEAKENFNKLESLKIAIEQMSDMDVKVESENTCENTAK